MAQVAPLAWALRQLAGSLNRLKIPYMVIGGVANLVWGELRTTQDIDVTIRVGADQIDDTLKALNRSFTIPYEEQLSAAQSSGRSEACGSKLPRPKT